MLQSAKASGASSGQASGTASSGAHPGGEDQAGGLPAGPAISKCRMRTAHHEHLKYFKYFKSHQCYFQK